MLSAGSAHGWAYSARVAVLAVALALAGATSAWAAKKPASCSTSPAKKTTTKAGAAAVALRASSSGPQKTTTTSTKKPSSTCSPTKKKKSTRKKKKTTAPPARPPATTPAITPATPAPLPTPELLPAAPGPVTPPADPPPPPPPAPGAAALDLATPEDDLGLGPRLVFSTVRDQQRAGHAATLSNTSGDPVTVEGLTLGGDDGGEFQLCAGQPASFTIAPGADADVCVEYRPPVSATVTGTQVAQGELTIETDDPGSPYVVSLGGLSQREYEGIYEPSAQQVLSALGYGNVAPVSGLPVPLALSPASTPIGDEVLAPYFLPADPGRPVSLVPLARYAGQPASSSQQFGWYARGSSTNHFLYAFPGGAATGGQNDNYGQNQLLLPTTTTGVLSFTPGGSFGIVDGQGWHTDDALNVSSAAAGHWHNFRVWPAKRADGTPIPSTYILGEDQYDVLNQSYKNWDYQDHMFVLTNATPDPTAMQPAAGVLAQTLSSFTSATATGFTGTLAGLDQAQLAVSGGQLQVTTSSDTPSTRVNALSLAINAATGLRVQARLAGPFTAIDAGGERQGVFFGHDASDYLEVAVANSGGSRAVVVTKVTGGSTSQQASVPLASGATTVDLRIEVAPYTGISGDPAATVRYAVDGGSLTGLGSAITLPTAWITSTSPAGIIATSEGGSPFTASYASFAVTRSY